MYKNTNMAISGNNTTKGQIQLPGIEQVCGLPPYPIDMSKLLTLWQFTLDDAGVPFQVHPAGYHPTIIGQYALANWNQYLATNDDYYRNVFLTQANWLVQHEAHICDGAGGWPISSPHPDVPTKGSWLSALAQGNAISVLIRAFQLTADAEFLEAAHRAVQTFKRDILDGGVSTPIGEDGIFFEEIAIYPARHSLSGFIFALFGLYEYTALTEDAQIQAIIERSHLTLHIFLDEFDTGFWTRVDLLHRRLASPSHLGLQVMLLEALVKYAECDNCTTFASRWKGYHRRFSSRLRYQISRHRSMYCHAILNQFKTVFSPKSDAADFLRICVPVTAFPVTGGMRTVLAGIAKVTGDMWQLEYLTQHVGPHPDGFVIHRFGKARMFPAQFPNVWLYCITGFCKLISLVRKGASYKVILPQDGVYTAAFAALAGKLTGIRVVCIDHGSLTLLNNRNYRNERIQALTTKHWSKPRLFLAHLRYALYWPSLHFCATIATRFADHFLIPGIVGDGVEEIVERLGVGPSRVTRFASVINIDRHMLLDAESRSSIREKKGISTDAIVISMICRLAPEKGLEIALEGISRALFELSDALHKQVRVIIAGDGPLHKHIEEDIRRCGLSQNCTLWGEIPAAETISLLGISDIFLYTSTRGACFSMSVLEAMASGCAVIASTEPMSNAYLLAEGRGVAIPPGDAEETGRALVRLINDLECRCQMGRLARDYVALQHSPLMFRRTLMRATYWP